MWGAFETLKLQHPYVAASFHVLKAKERPDELCLFLSKLSPSEEYAVIRLPSPSQLSELLPCRTGVYQPGFEGWCREGMGSKTDGNVPVEEKEDGKKKRWEIRNMKSNQGEDCGCPPPPPLFLLFAWKSSFGLCPWLIAQLVAHKHTCTKAHSQIHTCFLWTLYMAITMATKCTERSQGRVFLSFKALETTMETTQRKEETAETTEASESAHV